jgi:hypothetical protein
MSPILVECAGGATCTEGRFSRCIVPTVHNSYHQPRLSVLEKPQVLMYVSVTVPALVEYAGQTTGNTKRLTHCNYPTSFQLSWQSVLEKLQVLYTYSHCAYLVPPALVERVGEARYRWGMHTQLS